MFKILIKSVVLFILLLFNMALLTWCINQLLGEPPIKKTLISNVQAEAPPMSKSIPKVITQRPIRKKLHTAPNLHQGEPIERLVLRFKSIHIHLDKAERTRLEKILRRFSITSSHSVQIFSGAAHSKNNILSPQTAKLRAQNVARIIYPYTQIVKMHYRPSMEVGKVVVEFFEPSALKKK